MNPTNALAMPALLLSFTLLGACDDELAPAAAREELTAEDLLPEPTSEGLQGAQAEDLRAAIDGMAAQCGPVAWWYQNPWPTPWYDSSNCYVISLPAGAQGFIWNNSWYVHPGAGNSCSIGSFDGAHCYLGSAPAGTTAFLWGGNAYFTPQATPTSPLGWVGMCVQADDPAQKLWICENAGNDLANAYANGTYDTADYINHWGGDPCPAGTSIVTGSQFYVAGSCTPRPNDGIGCGGPGEDSYAWDLQVGVMCL